MLQQSIDGDKRLAPSWAFYESSHRTWGSDLNWDFADDWHLRLAYRYSDSFRNPYLPGLFADADGNFSVGGAASATLTDAADISVYNEDGPEASLSWDTDFVTWTADDATQAELDTFVFLEQVIDWGDIYANDIGYIQNGMNAFVNINSTCNAYFDGDVNFYTAGSGCNNTARIADVNFHEWGHGFHYYNLWAKSHSRI